MIETGPHEEGFILGEKRDCIWDLAFLGGITPRVAQVLTTPLLASVLNGIS